MITAKEAYQIARPNDAEIERHLEYLESVIRDRASKGKVVALIHEAPYAYWLQKPNDISKKVIKTLKEKGFTVLEHYRESQFVDIALIIKWGD